MSPDQGSHEILLSPHHHTYTLCSGKLAKMGDETSASSSTIRGSCLCGKITYEAVGAPVNSCLCFCNSCRKHTGSIGMANSWYMKEVRKFCIHQYNHQNSKRTTLADYKEPEFQAANGRRHAPHIQRSLPRLGWHDRA